MDEINKTNDTNENNTTKNHLLKSKEERRKIANKKRVQIISICAFLAVLAIATFASIPLVKALNSEDGMLALQEKLSHYNGIVGVLIFTVIQALQVVIAVIPPIQIVGGVLFGWFFGALLSFAGTMLGTLCIFLLVNKFGRPVVEAFIDEKYLSKYKFLHDEKKLTVILMILYLIPGIPKDVISYIVPLTQISKRDFFLYVMPCRLPAILMSTILGGNVIGGNFKAVIIVLIVAVVVGVLGFLSKDVIVNKMKQRRKNK